MTKEGLSTEEAAAILGVSDRHVRRLLAQGRLTGWLTGQHGRHGARGSARWYVDPLSIQEYEYWRERARQWRITRFLAMNKTVKRKQVRIDKRGNPYAGIDFDTWE